MPKKYKSKNTNIFARIGLPLYRSLIAAIILLSLVLTYTYSTLHSIKLPRIKYPRLKSPKISVSINYVKVSTFLAFSLFLGYSAYQFTKSLPDPHLISNYPSKLSTKILDRNGQLLYQIYQDENRTKISLESLPDHVKYAFLAAEDKNFYKHIGFSISGLFRALYRNVFNQKIEGGSTITQQLVKNTLLTSEKTIIRKAKELVLSLKIESIYTKDQIFETYLNQVGFGGPAYGIQEAAKQYFATDAAKLTISQAAYLAGLTKAPSYYSPFGENPEEGLKRQQIILKQMFEDKFITQDQLSKSNEEKIVFNSEKISINSPHFVMYVKDMLVNQLGEKTVTQDGLIVTTTIDSSLQNKVQKIVSDEIKKLQKLHVTNGAALVVKVKTGEILSMVGSVDYFDIKNNGQVNLTTSLRQPGSSIKPLNYALSFENGKKPEQTIEDQPITIVYPNQEKWIPKNYDGRFHGTISLRQALGNSYNIPSILLLKENGPEKFAKLAKKMGINTWDNPSRYGLSMALGSLEIKMTELATAYSAFANSGISTPLKTIIKTDSSKSNNFRLSKCIYPPKIQADSDGSVLANEDNCLERRVISAQTANQITDILSDNNARSASFGTNSVLNIKGVAVKTGTSNDLRDNWAIGYNHDYLVAVWVGNNDNSSMSKIASGITGASPIWSQIFKTVLSSKP